MQHERIIEQLRTDRGAWNRLPAGRLTARVGSLQLIVDTPADTHTTYAVKDCGGEWIVHHRRVTSTAEAIAMACDTAAHLLADQQPA